MLIRIWITSLFIALPTQLEKFVFLSSTCKSATADMHTYKLHILVLLNSYSSSSNKTE